MKLSYEADVDDFAEPTIRFYLRSKSARKSRLKSALIGAVILAATSVFIVRGSNQTTVIVAGLIGVGIGAWTNYYFFPSTVSKRIQKFIKNEHGDRLPTETTFTVGADDLENESFGIKVTFPLSQLTAITEDEQRLELAFGDKGLCTIPLRVFADPEAKAAFIASLDRAKS